MSRWGVLLGLVAVMSSAHAQVSFQSCSVEPNAIGPSTLFRAVIINTGAECEVLLEGEVSTRSGEGILSFKAASFRIPTGVTSIGAGDLVMRSFQYGTSAAARASQQFQRLTGGDYRYCLRLRAPENESSDQYCDNLLVDELLFLDLVQPWNKDTIDETRPALTWTIAGAGPAVEAADVRLVLMPMDKGRTPAQAVSAERPYFVLQHITDRTVPYPAGVNDLERGKCYAWQVERSQDGRVMDRSEPWGFCVREPAKPVHNKYVRLDRSEPGAIYEAVDQLIHFRYDEPYASTRLDCRIHDGKNKVIEPPVTNDLDGATDFGARSVGANVYELDLQPYGLHPGYYDLIVRDEKGRSHTLKFHIAR